MNQESKTKFFDELETKLFPVLKLKTFKQKKAFLNEVRQIFDTIIESSIKNDTVEAVSYRYSSKDIVRPNPNHDPNQHHRVMTESLSSQGDDVLQAMEAKKQAKAAKAK